MNLAKELLVLVLEAYFVLLMARLVLDWIQVFAREWKPRGGVLIIAEAVYTATDPPLKAVRKVIPPLRLGGIALDLGFLVVLLAVQVAINLLR